MLTEEQQKTPINLTAAHALIGLQLIDRILSIGNALRGPELTIVAQFRTSLVDAVKATTGVDYDNPVAKKVDAKNSSSE